MVNSQCTRGRGRFKDITGQRFGRLVAVSYSHSVRQAMWLCRCDCGKEKVISGRSLRTGVTVSCGCYGHEKRKAATTTHGGTLGGKTTGEYRCWLEMKSRCHNPKASHFEYYGGQGVEVCERWRESFEAFLADVGPMPTPKHNTIDRIRNEKGYEPGNVRWATRAEQMRNTRRNVNVTYDGRTMCLTDWATELGINFKTLRYRLKRWGVQRAFTEPVNHSLRGKR